MIETDSDVAGTQAYIERLQKMLCMLRKTETPANYLAMAQGYLNEIAKKETEIRPYLAEPANKAERAAFRQTAEVA